MNVRKILEEAAINSASDIWIIAGRPLSYKYNGTIRTLNEIILSPRDAYEFVTAVYALARREIAYFDQSGDDRFSFTLPRFARYRVSAYRQRGSCAAVLHAIPLELPDAETLKLPAQVRELSRLNSGLVLAAGPGGSGRSTTIAWLLDRINRERSGHILTFEEPVEYLHPHIRCIVSQREIPTDSESFPAAAAHARFQSPDVCMFSALPDSDTLLAAVAAAENQKLVFSAMHTCGAAETIDSLIHMVPVPEQPYFSRRLASVLRAVICQQLLPADDGSLVPSFEVLTVDDEIQKRIAAGTVGRIADPKPGTGAPGKEDAENVF